MKQLNHKQNKTLRKFFYSAVVNGYLRNVDMWDMQMDVLAAIGAVMRREADKVISYGRYRPFELGLIGAGQIALDVLWRDYEHGGWRRPADAAIRDVIDRTVARARKYQHLAFEALKTTPPRLAQCVFPLIEAILDHDGGPELKEGDDYHGFLDAKETAYAPYTSDEAFNKDREQCGEALADNMIGFLRQADDGNKELAECVMDWALEAFGIWHAEQYRYSRLNRLNAGHAGQQSYTMADIVRAAGLDIYGSAVFDIGNAVPDAGFLPQSGTVSAALDRFMAAYSTGEFPLDLTHDKIQMDKRAAERIPEELRGCLENGARSSYEWQRAFAAVGDRWIAEGAGGMLD